MKPKILILILLFTLQMVKSQSFDKKSSWTIITTDIFDDAFTELSTYKVDSDTLIGGKSYSKLLRNNIFFSALRETEDNKIYAYFSDIERELLIYDFDWRPNKILYYQIYDGENFVQAVLENSLDSIQLLDGKYYKCVKNYAEEVSLIRGIGLTAGFFGFTLPQTLNRNDALVSFYIDGKLIYCNPNFNNCSTNSLNDVNNNAKIKVYPNPTNDIVIIEFPENLIIDSFKIFDIKGSLIRIYHVKEKSKIEITNLEKGIYIYSVTTENNNNFSGKIIIK